MNYSLKYLLFIFLFTLENSSLYASNVIKLNTYQCLESNEVSNKLEVYISDCNRKLKKIDFYEIPNSTPKIDYVFFNNIKEKNNVFIVISYDENYRDPLNRFNYLGSYYMVRAYECDKNNNCKENEKVSNFFGSGGI